MADSIEIEPMGTGEQTVTEPANEAQETITTPEPGVDQVQRADEVPAGVIWTPRFIVIFALILIVGLSADSLLVQARDNGYLPGNVVLLVHLAFIFVMWVVIIVQARSLWIRLGGIFGCIWAIFSAINLIITLHSISPNTPILAHLDAAFSSALLGCYICLSIERIPLRRWDAWFFSIAPIVAICFVMALFFLTPTDSRSFSTIEDAIAGIANVLCLLIWWARPSCWKVVPGITFLFGVAPFTILLLSIPGLADGDTNFFFWEVMLLCILLGTIRFLQGDLRRKLARM
jgi:hypothetical protein